MFDVASRMNRFWFWRGVGVSVYDRPSSNFDGFLEVCLEKMRPQTSRALLLLLAGKTRAVLG